MKKEKENIPKQCRIGDTCFMSLAAIGGNLYTRHPNNLNRVHKDSKDLLSMIIILGTDVIPKECRIGDTCFMSLATIGGNLFKRHSNNLNHVHINSNNLMSVITILGTNVHGGETVFMMERKLMTLEK